MACTSCGKRVKKILGPSEDSGPTSRQVWYAISPDGTQAIKGPSLVEARKKARDGGGGGWTVEARREPRQPSAA